MKETVMNQEKLAKLQAQVRIGGKVNMFADQGMVIHINNPKVQASLAANTFTITGHGENKQLTEMLPGILTQLGADSLTSLRRLAESLPKQGLSWTRENISTVEEEDDDVPDNETETGLLSFGKWKVVDQRREGSTSVTVAGGANEAFSFQKAVKAPMTQDLVGDFDEVSKEEAV